MAGTVVTTEITHGSVKKIKFDWLSDAAGCGRRDHQCLQWAR